MCVQKFWFCPNLVWLTTIFVTFFIFLISSFHVPLAYALSIQCRDGNEEIQARIITSEVSYPESPILSGDQLFFVEYAKDQISVIDLSVHFQAQAQDLSSSPKAFWSKKGCGPAAISHISGGDFWVTCYDSHSIARVSLDGILIQEYTKTITDESFEGPNDFSGIPGKHFYFTASGKFTKNAPIAGKVFYLSPEHTIHPVASGIHYANGLAIMDSKQYGNKKLGEKNDQSLLVAEHLKNRILKYQIFEDGSLSKTSSVFADLSQFPNNEPDRSGGLRGPDGIRIGEDGIIYVAQYGGSRILKFNSLGEWVGEITIQSQFPNTDNVWISNHSIFISDVQETTEAIQAGVLILIHDKHLSTRKNLKCEII